MKRLISSQPTHKLNIAGLYRVWDKVQKRHPDWVLEITASGAWTLAA